jgi:uncharacterized membrane protein
VEVVLVRRVLRRISTPLVGVGRLAIGLVVLVGYVVSTGRVGGVLALGPSAWAWILLTGGVLAGYVMAWFGALHRAPATVVTSVLVGGAVITGALQALSRGGPPTLDVVVGYALIAVAVGSIAILTARGRALVGAGAGRTPFGALDG